MIHISNSHDFTWPDPLEDWGVIDTVVICDSSTLGEWDILKKFPQEAYLYVEKGAIVTLKAGQFVFNLPDDLSVIPEKDRYITQRLLEGTAWFALFNEGVELSGKGYTRICSGEWQARQIDMKRGNILERFNTVKEIQYDPENS